MDLTPNHSHLTPAAQRHLTLLISELESRLIAWTVAATLDGRDSSEAAEGLRLCTAARGAVLEALTALTWPVLHEQRAAELDQAPVTPRGPAGP